MMSRKIKITLVIFIIGVMETVQSAPKIRTSHFSSHEHNDIGNNIKIHPLKLNSKLQLPNGIELTFGKIVALAGDYYGVAETPIVTPSAKSSNSKAMRDNRRRFLKAYADLAHNHRQNLRQEVEKLVKMINEDLKVQTSGKGKFHSDKEWDEVTGGKWQWAPLVGYFPWTWGRMMKLAASNTDHFQPEAVEAYRAGHQCAINKAREAAKKNDFEEKRNMLMEAYAMEAFAGHYLSDCFSSGHIRTPRAELEKFKATAYWPLNLLYANVGDYLSKEMHDEDSKYGLRVKNKRGESWTAYGDKHLNVGKNARNYKLALEAMQKSANQVYKAFQDPTAKIDFNVVTDILPFVDPNEKNNTPLFQKKKGIWYYRSKLDLQGTHISKLGKGISAALYLWRNPTRTNSVNN